MSNLTRSGIAHDLNTSPYSINIEYANGDNLRYVFSSEMYKIKFAEKLINNRISISETLSRKFGFKVVNDKLADIKLYSTIETRGFLIKGKEDYICLDTVELIGVNLIQRS